MGSLYDHGACWLVLLTLLGGSVRAQGVPVLVTVAREAETPPKVDGAVNDPCWRRATWAGLFCVFGGQMPTQFPTSFAVCYDAKHLYLAVRCVEPHIDHLLVRNRGHDQAVWEDDAVEVFLGPLHDRRTYYQFVVNACGARFERSHAALGWNARWTAAARAGKQVWIAEMALPWREVGLTPVHAGQWLDLNVCRDRQQGPKRGSPKNREWSAWAPMVGSFHRPELFGHVYLGDARGSLPPMSALESLSRSAGPHGPPARLVRVAQPNGLVDVRTYRMLGSAALDRETSVVARQLDRVNKALASPRLADRVRRQYRQAVQRATRELAALREKPRARSYSGEDWEDTRLAVEALRQRLEQTEWDVKFALLFEQ